MIEGLIIGVIIGFLFSMPPLGPTYAAIIGKAAKNELHNAVSIGIGAGFMDLIYILAAYGGVTFISNILPDSIDNFFINNEEILKLYLGIFGCIVIIFYGVSVINKKEEGKTNTVEKSDFKKKIDSFVYKAEMIVKNIEDSVLKFFRIKIPEDVNSDLTGSFFVGITMCLSSPTLAASWFASVGYLKSLGLINSNFLTGIFLGIGVLAGTSIWFYLISKFIIKHKEKFSKDFSKKLNIYIGKFLVVLGVIILINILISRFI